MKFLVTFKLSQSSATQPSAKDLRALKEQLRLAKDEGIIEVAYGLASGGHIMIFNAPSNEALAQMLRKHPLFARSHIEVSPLVDAAGLLDWHVEHKTQSPPTPPTQTPHKQTPATPRRSATR